MAKGLNQNQLKAVHKIEEAVRAFYISIGGERKSSTLSISLLTNGDFMLYDCLNEKGESSVEYFNNIMEGSEL